MTTTQLSTKKNIAVSKVDTHCITIRVRGRRKQADAFAMIIRDVFREINVTVLTTQFTTYFDVRCIGYFGYIDAVERLAPHLLRGNRNAVA